MSAERLVEARKALSRYEDRNSKPNPAHLADAIRGLIALVEELEAEEPDWESTTPRGFGYTLIPVSNYPGEEPVDFSVQMSSLATEAKVWIGIDGHRAHMNVEEATRTRDALNAFLAEVKQEGPHEGHKIVEIPTYASSLIGRRCSTCEVELDPRRATDG